MPSLHGVVDGGGRPKDGRSPGAPRRRAEQRAGDATLGVWKHGAGSGQKSLGGIGKLCFYCLEILR